MSNAAWLDEPGILALLGRVELEVEGRLHAASNTTLRCRADVDGVELLCVVKPMSGERPLWDFPTWTLTRREIGAFELSTALGWDLVPPTTWREDLPGGPGMCQLWIDEDPECAQVSVTRPGHVPAGWRQVLEAEDGRGRPVVLAHADTLALRRMAVFDVLANNADRKGGHVLTGSDGRIWGIDHGVTFAVEEKLRTVLWGWTGEPIPASIVVDLERLATDLEGPFDAIDRWLDEDERWALRHRLAGLLRAPVHPEPSGSWPAIPWPVF